MNLYKESVVIIGEASCFAEDFCYVPPCCVQSFHFLIEQNRPMGIQIVQNISRKKLTLYLHWRLIREWISSWTWWGLALRLTSSDSISTDSLTAGDAWIKDMTEMAATSTGVRLATYMAKPLQSVRIIHTNTHAIMLAYVRCNERPTIDYLRVRI